MSVPYDLSMIQNSTSIAGTMQGINTQSTGMFGITLILMPSIIAFLVLQRYNNKVAIIGSSFLAVMLTIVMRMANMATDTMFYITLIIAAGAFIGSLIYRDQ